MKFLVRLFSSLWDIITSKKEVMALEAELDRVRQRVVRLTIAKTQLEARLKRYEQKAARDKMWEEGSEKERLEILKSRFRDR